MLGRGGTRCRPRPGQRSSSLSQSALHMATSARCRPREVEATPQHASKASAAERASAVGWARGAIKGRAVAGQGPLVPCSGPRTGWPEIFGDRGGLADRRGYGVVDWVPPPGDGPQLASC